MQTKFRIILWAVVVLGCVYTAHSFYTKLTEKPGFNYAGVYYEPCPITEYNGTVIGNEPDYMQKTPVTCGVSAMKYIFDFYTMPISEAEIAKNIMEKNGAPMLFMKRFAEKKGLFSQGFRLTLDEIKKLKPPFIAFVNQSHWVAVLWVKDEKVVLIDPLYGRVLLSQDDFVRIWKGEILTFEKR